MKYISGDVKKMCRNLLSRSRTKGWAAGEIKSRKWCRESPFNCARHLAQSKTFLDAPAISICVINYCLSFPSPEVCLLVLGVCVRDDGWRELRWRNAKRCKKRERRSPARKQKSREPKREVDVNAGHISRSWFIELRTGKVSSSIAGDHWSARWLEQTFRPDLFVFVLFHAGDRSCLIFRLLSPPTKLGTGKTFNYLWSKWYVSIKTL